MANPILTTLSKLVRKLAMALLVAALTLAAYGLWVYVRDYAGYEERRARQISQLEAGRVQARTELQLATARHDEVSAQMEAQRQRAAQISKAQASLQELEPGLIDRLFGDRDQIKTNEERAARLRSMKAETETRIVELQRELVAAAGERSAVETRLASLDRDIAEIDQEKHAAEHYAKAAWREARWLVAGVFAAYLFGGLVVAAGLYFLWAPLVARGRPLRLREEGEAERLGIGESAVVVEDAVWPGEVVWVRRRFLHLGEDGLSRHSRLLLSWRYPFGCWAAGLFRLIELRNGRNEGARRVLFADAVDPFAELVVVNVPEGASFVVRAGFVKGVIAGLERPPFVRRHWRLSRWQSWVSGQFAYVEFAGPCRLVVSCVSALQSETLALEGGRPGERRAPQAGLVGFSPLLELKPVRVAGFWRYCRRGARLFDVRLAGEGGFLLRDAQPGRRGRGAERFGGRLRKLVGL